MVNISSPIPLPSETQNQSPNSGSIIDGDVTGKTQEDMDKFNRKTQDNGFAEVIAPTNEEIDIMLELMMVDYDITKGRREFDRGEETCD
jgi:hypothetical protein